MSTPNVFEFEVFDVTALDVLVRGGFRLNGVDFCGLRSVYKADELAWAEDSSGSWKGAPAPRSMPTQLTISGSTPVARDAATERDTLLRVESDTPVIATWQLLYESLLPFPVAGYRVRVWNCATGAEVSSQAVAATSANIGVLPDGSYTLAVAIEDAAQVHLTEAEYSELTGETVLAQYRYTQNDAAYFYDYRKNLGVRPSDPARELNVLREELEAAKAQEDNPAWIQYATSHAAWGSQWAMIPFVVGEGDWERAAGVLAAPDCALIHAATSEETYVVTPANLENYQFAFDPFARSVVTYFKASDGTEYIAGERSCEDGTETALWDWNGGTPVLLATSKNYTTGLCECAGLQSAHEARRIAEDHEGRILVQTLCSLFRYDPFGHRVEDKLVPHPRASDGHPGGRSLVVNGKSVSYTTEYFGDGNESGVAAQFYDTFISRSGEIDATSGIGCVAHLDGNLAVYKSRVMGVIQDRYDLEIAKQSVAQMTAAGWQLSNMSGYPALSHQLQRVARIGWHLVATGKERNSENPLFIGSDGVLIQRAQSTYRVRHIDAVMNPTGFETGLAPGFLPTDNFGAPRRLIEIGDRATGRVLDDEPLPEVDCTDAACQLADFGDGAVWFGEPLHVWNGEVSGVAVVNIERHPAPSAAKPFSEYFKENLAAKDALIWARIDSELPADALETYIYPVPVLGDLWMLPEPAREKVEFVIVLPESAEKIEPLRLMEIC